MKHVDYIYRNINDTVRIKIFRFLGGGWNIDEWKRGIYESPETYSVEMGDVFRTKREAKAEMERKHGKLILINSVNTVTEGW